MRTLEGIRPLKFGFIPLGWFVIVVHPDAAVARVGWAARKATAEKAAQRWAEVLEFQAIVGQAQEMEAE